MSFKNVKYGKYRERRNYSRVQTNVELPNLIEVQTKSFEWFITDGLKELFAELSPIKDNSEKLELYFKDFEFDEPKYNIPEAKRNNANYSRPLKVNVVLKNNETGEIKERKIFLGEFPMMTPGGTFVINGAERVIVTQILRSAGAFYSVEEDKKTGLKMFSGQIIPTRGAWIEFEIGSKEIWYAKLDRSKKIHLTTFLRAIGLNSNRDMVDLFGNSRFLMNTLEKDLCFGSDDSLERLYDNLRPGEKATPDGARNYLCSRLFDTRRYDLASVGRYKINKKLDVLSRITGLKNAKFANNIINPETGEIIYEAGTVINNEIIDNLRDHREYYRNVRTYDQMLEGNSVTLEEIEIVIDRNGTDEHIKIVGNDQREDRNHVTLSDIIAAVSYYMNLHLEIGKTDDIDHLSNRRLRLIGELLQNQFRIGLAKLEKNVRDRMSTSNDTRNIDPQNLINVRTLTSSIRDFFGSSQLSQFMDQINPLSELTHKRRISALGAGGLTRDRAGFEVRDVHVSHYGRICPIETPEGQNIGLINSLATYAKVDKYGFIETPYFKVVSEGRENPIVTNEIVYLTADKEEPYCIAQANTATAEKIVELPGNPSQCLVDKNGKVYPVNSKKAPDDALLIDLFHASVHDERGNYVYDENQEEKKYSYYLEIIPQVVMSRKNGETEELQNLNAIDFMDVSPKQIVAVSTACIPFLEHDDANRALMGANMQRQAIPLFKPEAAFVATGIEEKAAKDSGVAVICEENGIVEYSDAKKIIVRGESGALKDYVLIKYERSNNSTCCNQRPIVKKGDLVQKGEVLADGASMDKGEMALGRNVVIAFMTWNGYNYEDAVIMNERLVQDDVYTSIHIEKYEVEVRDTKLGKEELTRELDNEKIGANANLDEHGIIRLGAEVKENDILVGKVTPKGQTDPSPEERLSHALFSDNSKDVRNSSLRVPHGGGGIVHRIEHFRRKDGDELPPGVNEVVRVFIVQKRKITEGDKMSGRHGNKGVISRILPQEDMPYLPDGTPVDIMLNPQGIPSRLNIGQVFEIHLGMAAKRLGIHVATPVFDGVSSDDLQDIMAEAGMEPDGKTVLIDGRTGKPFDNRISVGVMYMIKLAHMVDDKLHARSDGKYTLVTQQPMGGKAQNGGQRFGEMEVWALEAYGAAYTLREMLTIKSDDMVGRNKVCKAIVDGFDLPEPGIPESFRVLIKELQSLGIRVELIDSKSGKDVANNSLVEEIAIAQKENKLS